ncbi:hypothetical protein LCGC14_1114030 [marine sediment metagenome]|uniref:Uncharacterized protein n=1 Tax=marine sediment metagenome TaxID=412755 RepID=A0A0F9QBZ8_9ZZZZ
MDPKSTVKIINKDIDKLEKEYARGKVSVHGIMKEQEAIMDIAEKELEKVKKKIIITRKSLEPYRSGKSLDDDFLTMKNKYERLLVRKEQLEKTVQIVLESIGRGKLNLI